MKCPLLTQMAALAVVLAVVFTPVAAFATLEEQGAVLEAGVSNTFSEGQIEGIMTHFEMCGLVEADLHAIYDELTQNQFHMYQIINNMTSSAYSNEESTIVCGENLESKYTSSSSIEDFIFGVEIISETSESQLREETQAAAEAAEAKAKAEAKAAAEAKAEAKAAAEAAEAKAKAEAKAAAEAAEAKAKAEAKAAAETAAESEKIEQISESKCTLDEELTKKQFKKEAKNYIECLKDELKQAKKSLKETLSKKDFKEQFKSLQDQFKQTKKQVEQQVKNF